ncbi:MAG: helix-turn-helix domain-containing protein [Planctomycetia bacterium]|nr:helix-turn-helix domain-containing protein [Planctomycetia bacterium]
MKTLEFKLPSASAAEQARTALRALTAFSRRRTPVVRLRPEGAREETSVSVPLEAFDLFMAILAQMANGNAVTIVPLHAELTTQQVADLLNVSRPYVIELLEAGKIPSRKVGTHRRVRAEDVLAYRQREEERRKAVLAELTAEAEKHGLGY